VFGSIHSDALFGTYRHTPKDKGKLLCNLPEDPPCLPSLRCKHVRQGDFRKGLRPGVDWTVHTSAKIKRGTVLGLYRNFTVTKVEEKIIKNNPPVEFTGSNNEWRRNVDAYIADIEQPPKQSKTARHQVMGDIFQNVMNVRLVCSMFRSPELHLCHRHVLSTKIWTCCPRTICCHCSALRFTHLSLTPLYSWHKWHVIPVTANVFFCCSHENQYTVSPHMCLQNPMLLSVIGLMG